MAETRKCGYCMQPGHRKPACPMFAEQRHKVLTHTPIQRKELIATLGRMGLGNGALISIPERYGGDKRLIGIVHNFDWVSNCNFMDHRCIKYTKQVRLDERTLEADYEYRNIHMTFLETGSGSMTERNLGIRISRHIRIMNGAVAPNTYAWDPPVWKIESPSYETDYDPEILVMDVVMPRRLLIGNEQEYHMRGIMPPTNA